MLNREEFSILLKMVKTPWGAMTASQKKAMSLVLATQELNSSLNVYLRGLTNSMEPTSMAIPAIKAIRTLLGNSLKEAKDLLDETRATGTPVLVMSHPSEFDKVFNAFKDVGIEAYTE